MNWQKIKLKYIARFAYGDALPKDGDMEGFVKVFGSNGVYDKCSQANTQAPAIIVGRKGSYGKVNWSDESCFASDTTFFIDVTTTHHHLRWLFYVLQTLNLDQGTYESAVPGLNRDDAYTKEVFIPSPFEQEEIARYLDRQTAKIDELIKATKRLLELLDEQRRALITHAVTRGLNSDVPMRGSGVEWIGEIPKHWEILRLRRVVKNFVDYRGQTPTKVDQGIPLITARNIKEGLLSFVDSIEFISPEIYTELMVRGFPEVGDVIVTTEAPLGNVAQIIDPNVALAQRIILLKVDFALITNEYLKYYFLSLVGQKELYSQATGSTAEGIKASKLKEILVFIPSINEQKAIARYIDQKIAKIDRLIRATKRTMELLQERRTSLITAAVTRQIKIKE